MRKSNANQKKVIYEQDGLSDATVETKFSERNWGEVTCDYIQSAITLEDKSKDFIFTEARHLAKCIRSHSEEDSGTSITESEKPLGCHAMLVDII